MDSFVEFVGQSPRSVFFIAPFSEVKRINTSVYKFKFCSSLIVLLAIRVLRESRIAEVPLHQPLFAEAVGSEESLEDSRGRNASRSRGTSLATHPVGLFCTLYSTS